MTLSERNAFFKAGIAFCVIVAVLSVIASFLIIPVYSSITEENPARPINIVQAVLGKFLKTNYYAVHASIVLVVLFSLVWMLLIHYFFERTSTPEILYISFFIFSFSFEIIRLIIPIHLIYNFPYFYLLNTARILLFARYFGIFSLFTASVCAAGFEVQKTRNIIFILITTTLLMVFGIPIDTQTWDTSFKMVNSYNTMLRIVEAVVFIMTAVDFLVAAKVRDSKEYIYTGIGVVFAFIGRNIILGTDNLAGPALGIILMSFGTWTICSKLHKIHLWL